MQRPGGRERHEGGRPAATEGGKGDANGKRTSLRLVAVALTGLWVRALVDAVRLPDARFKAGSTLVWVVTIIAVVGLLGAIIYVLDGHLYES